MKKEHLDKLRPLFLRQRNLKNTKSQRNLENNKISLAKFDGITTGEEFFGDIAAPPRRFKTWSWSPLTSGDCRCDDATLTIDSLGTLAFVCNLTSSDPGDDSWVIWHFDFSQPNGGWLTRTGEYPSPTIVGVNQLWYFTDTYWHYYFDSMTWVSMTYHC